MGAMPLPDQVKRLGLEDEAALQTAFINEMGAYVAKREAHHELG